MRPKTSSVCLYFRIAATLVGIAVLGSLPLFAQATAQQPMGATAQQSVAPQQATSGPQSTPAAPVNLMISPGDLIIIDVFNTPELSGKFRVDQTGNINLPQGGVVSLSGLSSTQAGKAIEQRFRDAQIMLDPHVSVFVQEYASQGVIVMGEVRNPGTYTLFGEHSLYGALAAAGGPTTNQGDRIVVTHQANPEKAEIIPVTSPDYSELQRTTRVNPGDTVFVSRASVFYVVGNVGHTGAFPIPLGQPVHVLEAIAVADGTQRATADSKASIIRSTPNGPKTIPIDIKKIYKNESPNLQIEAFDILVIPRSGVKAILDTALPLAASATINAVIASLVLR